MADVEQPGATEALLSFWGAAVHVTDYGAKRSTVHFPSLGPSEILPRLIELERQQRIDGRCLLHQQQQHYNLRICLDAVAHSLGHVYPGAGLGLVRVVAHLPGIAR